MRSIIVCFFSLLLYSFGACQTPTPVRVVSHSGGEKTFLLDKKEAGEAVVRDRYDAFFDRVTLVEMSIQMKKPVKDLGAIEQKKAVFAQFLKDDMDDFSPSESAWVAKIMEEVYSAAEAVFPGLYPDSLWMAKTKASHYGNSVYYTRENGIVIPKNVLSTRDDGAFRSTMLHELFHIYSRLHPAKREELYALIGFQAIGYNNVNVPGALAERLLHNPDGVDFAQKIDLKQSDGSYLSAIPIIYANKNGFQKGEDAFFAYLSFALFPVAQDASGKWTIKTAPDGVSSPIDLRLQSDFFRQIRDNTNYIIHPDEILADNFAFIVEGKTNPKVTAGFSAAGKALLLDMEAVLKK